MLAANQDQVQWIDERLHVVNAAWNGKRAEAFVTSGEKTLYTSELKDTLSAVGLWDENKPIAEMVEQAKAAQVMLPSSPVARLRLIADGQEIAFEKLDDVVEWIKTRAQQQFGI